MVCWRPVKASPSHRPIVLVAVATLVSTLTDVGSETVDADTDDGTASKANDEGVPASSGIPDARLIIVLGSIH